MRKLTLKTKLVTLFYKYLNFHPDLPFQRRDILLQIFFLLFRKISFLPRGTFSHPGSQIKFATVLVFFFLPHLTVIIFFYNWSPNCENNHSQLLAIFIFPLEWVHWDVQTYLIQLATKIILLKGITYLLE